MPMYSFENPETLEVIDVFFHMNDDKKYIDSAGLEWKRLLLSPQLNTEASIDPWSNEDFVNKTSNTKGTMGDLLDRSAEMSAKRAEGNNGVDPVKQKALEDYSKKTGGKKHTSQLGQKKTFETKDVKVDFD